MYAREVGIDMKAKLVVVKGAEAADIPLRLPTVIGRSREASVKVRTTVVSRMHCELFEKNGKLFVKDLESANGTFVNDVRINEPTELTTGDTLTVGPVMMKAIYTKSVHREAASDSCGEGSGIFDASSDKSGSIPKIQYKETVAGSFLGIDDSMLNILGSASRNPDKRVQADALKSRKQAIGGPHTDAQQDAESIAEAVDHFDESDDNRSGTGDSALNKFFDDLD